VPKYDFPAFSERGPQNVAPGQRWDEHLFEWNEKSNGRGAEIGKAYLTHSGEAHSVRVTTRVEFHNGKEVTYEGPVPGGNTWKGESSLRRIGGDPDFPRTLKVRCWNPKRWG
jgi:hypothetical protein